MNIRYVTILSLVLLLGLTGCSQPVDESALNTAVAATLVAIEVTEPVQPIDTSVPTATEAVTAEPTEPQPTETQASPTPMSDAEAIKAALIEYLNSPADPASVTVSEIQGKLARGGLQGAYFVAAKEGQTWLIIYAGQATPDCDLINPYAFPTAWIPECLSPNGTLVVRSEPDVHPDLASLGPPTWRDTMDSRGRWYLVNTSNTIFTIEGGKLVMNALEAGSYDEWGVAAGNDQTDFYLEITAKTGSQCSGLDRYGMIVRVPDPTQGIVFEFSCDGRFRLYEWDGETYTGLQGWKANSAILAGPDKENRQGVMVVGDKVKLFANDKLLGEYTIEDYPQGRFGLVVGSSDTDNFKVLIDSASFWNLAN